MQDAGCGVFLVVQSAFHLARVQHGQTAHAVVSALLPRKIKDVPVEIVAKWTRGEHEVP